MNDVVFSHLRVMDESDLDWVAAIEPHCYPIPWSRKGLELALRHGMGFVFCDRDDAPLGYCFVQMAADEVELLNFTVAPDAQGQGVGKAALKALLDRFDGGRFTQLFLEVRASNTPAIRLYQGAGFNEIGLRPNYYRNLDGSREDAILMAFTFL